MALHRNASFWTSAGVVMHTFWTSAAPAMAYPLYAQEWHLTPTVTTAIFAVYPITVVATLILAGDLSDSFGRRNTMLLGLMASIAGVLAFAVAPDVAWLFVGRVAMGIGVGLSAGPSTAAMVEFDDPDRPGRASTFTTVAQSAGFVCAFLISGELIQYAPFPTRLSFLLLLVVLLVLFAATWQLPRRAVVVAQVPWRPRKPSIPPAVRSAFLVASLAVTTAYTHGVLILSLGSAVARDLVGSSNSLVNGAVLSLFAVMIGIVGLAAKGVAARRGMFVGALASLVSMGIMALAVAWHSLAAFMVAAALGGTGYALLFRAGLDVITLAAPSDKRGGILSALYLLAYLSLGTVAVALGKLATYRGLELAVDVGAAFIAILSLLAAAAALRSEAVRAATRQQRT